MGKLPTILRQKFGEMVAPLGDLFLQMAIGFVDPGEIARELAEFPVQGAGFLAGLFEILASGIELCLKNFLLSTASPKDQGQHHSGCKARGEQSGRVCEKVIQGSGSDDEFPKTFRIGQARASLIDSSSRAAQVSGSGWGKTSAER